jgi:hypothetical protein
LHTNWLGGPVMDLFPCRTDDAYDVVGMQIPPRRWQMAGRLARSFLFPRRVHGRPASALSVLMWQKSDEGKRSFTLRPQHQNRPTQPLSNGVFVASTRELFPWGLRSSIVNTPVHLILSLRTPVCFNAVVLEQKDVYLTSIYQCPFQVLYGWFVDHFLFVLYFNFLQWCFF